MLPPTTTAASPINMLVITPPLTDDEFSKKYCYNEDHKVMVPDDGGPELDTFLNLRQLESVDNLHIVLTVFWLPVALGYLQGARDDCASLQILQRVLDKLTEAKAGKGGPLLESR